MTRAYGPSCVSHALLRAFGSICAVCSIELTTPLTLSLLTVNTSMSAVL